ncbi:MAG: hypothetical protein QM698_07265 [Micropepsaceae bacterium]
MKLGDISLKSALVILSLAEFAAGFLPRIGIGTEVAARSAVTENSVTPAGYAFSIWGVIFLTLIAYAAVYAWRGTDVKIARRLAIAMAANTLWSLYVQSFAIDFVSVAIILTGLSAALLALGGAVRSEQAGIERLLSRAGAGLLAGWLTVAAAANIAAAMQHAGMSFGDLGEPTVALLLLLAFGGLAILAAGRTRSFYYAGAAIWGLAAVAARRWEAGSAMDLVIAGAVIALAVAILGMVFAARRARA